MRDNSLLINAQVFKRPIVHKQERLLLMACVLQYLCVPLRCYMFVCLCIAIVVCASALLVVFTSALLVVCFCMKGRTHIFAMH